MDPQPPPGMGETHATEELAGEEALHSALASIPGVSVIVFDHESRIRALHGTALERHGYVHDAMLGRRTDEVLPPPVWARLAPLYAQALAGETVTIHQTSQDGEAVYESTFSPILRDGQVIAGTMTSRDITAQAKAEEELAQANAQFAEANAQFQAILDHSPTAIYLRDRDQRWVVTNAETCGSSAPRPRSSSAARWRRRSAPEWVGQAIAHDREVVQTGQATSFDEYVRDARTGETRHLWSHKFPVRDSAGRIVGVGGVSLDVTDRERAARELAAARSLFETAFASAPVGMLVSRIYDDNTVDVIECNPAFAACSAATRPTSSAVLGTFIVHPDDLPLRKRMIEDLLAGRPASGEMRFKHRDGHDICALTCRASRSGPTASG